MHVERIKYRDYKGTEREEDFFFNLSPAEITEMEISKDGGMGENLRKIIAANDQSTISRIYKEIVLKAYGVVSDDGRRFIKNQEVVDAFVQSEAYSQFYMSLLLDQGKMEAFINNVIPDMSEYEKKIKGAEVAQFPTATPAN